MREWLWTIGIGLALGVGIYLVAFAPIIERPVDPLDSLPDAQFKPMRKTIRIRHDGFKLGDRELDEIVERANQIGHQGETSYVVRLGYLWMRWQPDNPLIQFKWFRDHHDLSVGESPVGLDLGLKSILTVNHSSLEPWDSDWTGPLGFTVCGIDGKGRSVVKFVHFDGSIEGLRRAKIETVVVSSNDEIFLHGAVTNCGGLWVLDIKNHQVLAFGDGDGPGIFDEQLSEDFPMDLSDQEWHVEQVVGFFRKSKADPVCAVPFWDDHGSDPNFYFNFFEDDDGRWHRADWVRIPVMYPRTWNGIVGAGAQCLTVCTDIKETIRVERLNAIGVWELIGSALAHGSQPTNVAIGSQLQKGDLVRIVVPHYGTNLVSRYTVQDPKFYIRELGPNTIELNEKDDLTIPCGGTGPDTHVFFRFYDDEDFQELGRGEWRVARRDGENVLRILSHSDFGAALRRRDGKRQEVEFRMTNYWRRYCVQTYYVSWVGN